jgi:membrane-associated phospholipid phosphatase
MHAALPPRTELLMKSSHVFPNLVTVTVAVSCLCWTPPCAAADFTLPGAWEDTKLYFTAPLRWDPEDWLIFGGTVGAVAAAHELDGSVRNHFAGKTPVLDGKDAHSTRDALPAAALVGGTFAAAVLAGSPDGRNEAYRMLEAAVLSGVTAEALKYAAGRARPDETLRVDDWRTGGSSFPSLHSTAAFAIGTVLAESGSDDYRWTRRLLGYGMASFTAYERLHGNAHWLSDVVAGSAIGLWTGVFVTQRQLFLHSPVTFNVAPTEAGGISLQLTYTPRL